MICGSAPSYCSSLQGEQKITPAHPNLPAHTAMGKRSAARICWILGAAQLQRKFPTHTGAFWGSWKQKRDFSSPRTLGLEERSTHLTAPTLGLYPVSCCSLGQPPAGLDSHLFAPPCRGSAPHRRVSVPWINPTLLSEEGWRETPGLCDHRAPPKQLSSIPHAPNSPFPASMELHRLNRIPESLSLKDL